MSRKPIVISVFLVVAIVGLLSMAGCDSSSGDASDPAQPSLDPSVFAVKIESRTIPIAFQTINQDDPSLQSGTTMTKQQGVNGSVQISYTDIYLFGEVALRVPFQVAVSAPPVTQIVAVGTSQPAESDTQIASTSDNGPSYDEQKAAAAAELQKRVQDKYRQDTENAKQAECHTFHTNC